MHRCGHGKRRKCENVGYQNKDTEYFLNTASTLTALNPPQATPLQWQW
jgi:hypothetical protein